MHSQCIPKLAADSAASQVPVYHLAPVGSISGTWGIKRSSDALLCVSLCMQMLRQVFEEGLELQKARLREQCTYAKEQRQERSRKHKDEIEAMENYYRDQVITCFSSFLQKVSHWVGN